MAEVKRYVGDSQGGIITVSGDNPVENDLHWNRTGGRGTVSGTVASF